MIPTTNWKKGRGGHVPIAFVVHIQQGYQNGTKAWFNNPKSGVSSHVAISKKGGTDKFVDENDTAYHAGRVNKPVWPGMKKTWWGFVNPNLYTIGIECEGFRGDTWTEPQMKALCVYIKEQAKRFNIAITRRNIISHNEITADKEDMTKWCDEVVKRLNTQTRYQVTAPKFLSQYKAADIEKVGGKIFLREGVVPIEGTTKTITL